MPFRNGGLEPDDIARHVDGGTVLVAFSGVQTATRAPLRHRARSARSRGRWVRSCSSTARSSSARCRSRDDLDADRRAGHRRSQVPAATPGRGLGYCYLSRAMQDRFVPINAGWKAGRVPVESFFGPAMDLSPTASRFDNSISWLAAIGNEAALSVFDDFGADAIYGRNRELAELLRAAARRDRLDAGRAARRPIAAPSCRYRSATPIPRSCWRSSSGAASSCSARDGNLRLAIHFYNHEDHYRQIATVQAGNGLSADGHEFLITPLEHRADPCLHDGDRRPHLDRRPGEPDRDQRRRAGDRHRDGQGALRVEKQRARSIRPERATAARFGEHARGTGSTSTPFTWTRTATC